MRSDNDLHPLLPDARLAFAALLLALAVLQVSCDGGSRRAAPPSDLALDEVVRTLTRSIGLDRVTYLAELLQTADAADRDRIRTLFDEGRIAFRQLDLILVGVAWAEEDPRAAYTWLSQTAPSGGPAVLRIWARTDPEAALRTVMEVRGETRGRSLSAVAQGWYDSGRPGLDQFIRGLDPYDENIVIAALVTQVASREGSEALMAWSESFALGARGGLTLYRKTALVLGRTDPTAVKEWIARHATGPLGSNLIKLAATAWADHDGQGAFEWLETLPESEERRSGVEEGFRRWHRKDPDAAGEWLREAGVVPWLEPAHVIYATRLTDEDPLAAIEWARRISQDALRDRALFRVVRRWRFRDETAARAWIDEQSDLSPEQIERMMAPIGKPRSAG